MIKATAPSNNRSRTSQTNQEDSRIDFLYASPYKCERFGSDSQILAELRSCGFTWMLQVLTPEPESPEGSTPESEAESNPKRNLRPPQGENLRRIP
jgi:hypothetical protein